MKLSKRLQTIADFIPEKSKVIDVGADHGLLDIYLAKEKNCHASATDISAKCIDKIKSNIEKYKVNIDTKLTDGLNDINLNDEIIVISGMGTHSIMKILNKKITNDLIISSHRDIPLLRKFLKNKGYKIFKEQIISDKHYYVITYYKYKQGKSIKNLYSFNNEDYVNDLKKQYKFKYQHETNIIRRLKYFYIFNKIKREG